MSRAPIEADTVGRLVARAADTFGDPEAVVGSGRRLTFRQLEAESRAVARRLVNRGLIH